jgi:hypothetical protein
VPPDLVDVSFVFFPSPSRLNYTFNTTLLEANVTTGMVPPLRIGLVDDYWNTTTAPQLFRDLMRRQGRFGATLATASSGSLFTLLSLNAFTFPAANVMQIQFQRDETYNAVDDEELVLFLSSGMTVSGVAPSSSNITLIVRSGQPRLIASGTALDAGSRAFILGGLQLELYLENDLFESNALLPSDICPFAQCVIATSNSQRRLTVSFLATPTTVQTTNTTFTIYVRPTAMKSRSVVNNVTMRVALEPGLATLTFLNLPSTVTEETISSGALPALRISVVGDRLINDPDRLARALAQGCTCTPPSDQYGFCSRALALFTSIAFRVDDNRQSATITLQPDDLYDIYAKELVNISIGKLGMDSGLAPTGWTLLDVDPVRGDYQFSATATTVAAAVIRDEDAFNLDVIFALRHERFIADPTSAVVIDGSRSTQSEADEANGYERLKSTLYHQGVVSSDRRVLRLSMHRAPTYASGSDETITFRIPTSAVMGPLAPTLISPSATITIKKSGGTLTLLTPTVTTVDRVRSSGINITVTSSDRWGAVYLTGLSAQALQDVVTSSSSPVEEPRGFTVLKQAMMSRSISVDGHRLDLMISRSSSYDLVNDEVLTIHFSDTRWGALDRPMVPDAFQIVVKAKVEGASSSGYVVLFMPSPVDEGKLQRALAQFLGVTTDVVVVTSNEEYDVGGVFRRVGIDLLPGSSRTPTEAATFLVGTNSELLRSRLNISTLYKASAPLSGDEVDVRLGLRTQNNVARPNPSLVWVWVSIAVLVVAAVAAFAYYRFRVVGRMKAATSKQGRSAPLLKVRKDTTELHPELWSELADGTDEVLNLANWHAYERGANFSAENSPEAATKTLSADAAVDILAASQTRPGSPRKPVVTQAVQFVDLDDDISGPSMASAAARAVRIDLDEYVDSRQPPGFLRHTVAPLKFEQVAPRPVSQEVVAIYPPGTPSTAKFRTQRLDFRSL